MVLEVLEVLLFEAGVTLNKFWMPRRGEALVMVWVLVLEVRGVTVVGECARKLQPVRKAIMLTVVM